MSKNKAKDEKFEFPVQYLNGFPPVQVDFPADVSSREGSLHLVPGRVKFVSVKELEFLEKLMPRSFKELAVKKAIVVAQPVPVIPASTPVVAPVVMDLSPLSADDEKNPPAKKKKTK